MKKHLLLTLLLAGRAVAGADDTELRMNLQSGQVEFLRHVSAPVPWTTRPFSLFQVSGPDRLHTELERRSTQEGLLLTLRIRNDDLEPRLVTPAFPNIELKGATPEDHRLLRYCFPARSARVSRDNVSDRGYYSGIFPVQFLAADHPSRGSLHVVVCDKSNTRKLFGVDKSDDTLRLFVEYEGRILAPGEEWALPPVLLSTSGGTWHSGLKAYRSWLASWYRPAVPRSASFREVFNFRVCYLYNSPQLNSGIFDAAAKKWTLPAAVDGDVQDFGGVDFIHFFDWSQTPEQGRVGDYAPWPYLGGLSGFREQIKALEERRIPAGLYLEGYLASVESKVAKASGPDWMMTDEQGRRVDQWGGGYYTMCPHVPGWQDYLADTCRRLAKEAAAAGLYIDEFGFLTQYRCFNPEHAPYHPKGAHMLAGELGVLRKIRESVGSRAVLYTEEIPTDVMTQFSDGAYTAAVKGSLKKGVPCPIHLTRFALPDFKTIELVSEEGLQDDFPSVQATFFNGEGLYLSGSARMFSPRCLALIRKTHALLREYADAFTSLEPAPLVPTLRETVCANCFPAARRTVWTLFNAEGQPYDGPVLRVPHRPGARYRDVWNGIELTPAVAEDGYAEIRLAVGPGEVGCVVQSW